MQDTGRNEDYSNNRRKGEHTNDLYGRYRFRTVEIGRELVEDVVVGVRLCVVVDVPLFVVDTGHDGFDKNADGVGVVVLFGGLVGLLGGGDHVFVALGGLFVDVFANLCEFDFIVLVFVVVFVLEHEILCFGCEVIFKTEKQNVCE